MRADMALGAGRLPGTASVGLPGAGAATGTPQGPVTAALQAALTSIPAAARAVTVPTVPQSNAALGTAALFFLSAFRGGDVRGWLGERTLQSLEAGGREATARLSAAFSKPSAPAPEPAPGEWRLHTIPMLHDGQVMEIRLMHRDQQEETSEADPQDEAGRRFVLDVEMSRLGPMQLDGLVRDRLIRLVVRSTRGLDGPLRDGIRQVFRAACEAIGHEPSLTFAFGSETWVRGTASP